DRQPDRRGDPAPRLRADREPRQVPDARPLDLQEPPVLGRVAGGVHQRPGPVRADVRVRLLLAGRAGELADPGRCQARTPGRRDADLLAAGRRLGRPPGLTRDGGGRHARAGRRAGPDDHAAARYHVYREWRLHADRRGRLGDVQLAEYSRDDGYGPRPPAWDRRGRPGARPEHRRGHLDRVRARGGHLVGPEERAVPRVQRAGPKHHERAAGPVHVQHAHRAVVPGRDLAGRRGDLRRATRARESLRGGGDGVSTTPTKPLRIGEVADLLGTTPRTIRYYEEIGLLPDAHDREQGKHRCYTEVDVERVREIMRLRDLLGLT